MKNTKSDNQDNLTVNIEKKPGCQVELEITVPPSLIQEAKKHALKELKKDIEMPGFRKGKAPDAVVLKQYPTAYEQKWHKTLADLSYVKAFEQQSIPKLSPESKIVFNMKSISDSSATLSYSYETEPEVPTINPKEFKFQELHKHEVTDKKVDEVIHQSRFFFAEWKNIEDRPIQENDYIIVDIENIDVVPPQKALSDIRFEVKDEGMAKWMKKLVLGAKLNDVLEGISVADDHLSEQEKQEFAPKKVRVTIKKIEEANLPELNDDFATRMGSTNVDALKKAIYEMLCKQEEEHVLKEKREQVAHFLTDHYSFDLPTSLLESEKKARKENLLKDPEFKDRWNSANDSERKEIDKNIALQSQRAIKLFYITRKIIYDNNIKISDEEIRHEAIHILQRSSNAKFDEKNISKDTFALALSHLVLSKAEDYVLEESAKT
ncbi:MAG: trigger factor [Chlamydiae bacterium]|nr:trigger factor [Chlamydiota bacterium]